MSANNGVIRIGRKGFKKFAFGEDGKPFDVDVVVAFQGFLCVDDDFRERDGCVDRVIKTSDMPEYHRAIVDYVERLAYIGKHTPIDQTLLEQSGHASRGNPRIPPPATPNLTVAEALEFIALLREEYEALLTFFRPRLPEEPDSPGTSEGGLQFSEEAP